MYLLVYNFLLFALVLLTFPYFLVKFLLVPRYRRGLSQRFGFFPLELKEKLKGNSTIWIHAVSVGEVVATKPILSALKGRYPHYRYLISTVTETGNRMAQKIVKEAEAIIYFPLDFPWVVARVLKLIKPRLFIMIETELWPNFIWQAGRLGVPLMWANGRISPNSFAGYRKVRWFVKRVLRRVDLFGMQTALDAQRIISLGADPSKVYVTGNSKFDQMDFKLGEGEKEKLYQELGLTRGYPVVIAGSTHEGEEEMVLNAFKKVRDRYREAILILAPRRLERIAEIETLVQSKGFHSLRRTRMEGDGRREVVILDTMGELAKIYSLGTVIFVGGSLVPWGGHNILEPASLGKPVVFGPYMHNFLESARLLKDSGGGIMVQDEKELAMVILDLLSSPNKASEMGCRAAEVVERNKGASLRTAELVGKILRDEIEN